MSCAVRDLTLDEALADPVIGAVLKADHIDRFDFEILLRATVKRLGSARAPRDCPTAPLATAHAHATTLMDLAAW